MAKITAEHVKRDWDINLSDSEFELVIAVLEDYGPDANRCQELAQELRNQKYSYESCC